MISYFIGIIAFYFSIVDKYLSIVLVVVKMDLDFVTVEWVVKAA